MGYPGGAVDAVSLGYAVKAASADVATDGHYFPATNVLTLCLVDSDGATAPIPPVGTEIALGYCNPWGAISSDTLTVVSTAVTPFHLTITFTIEGGQPAIGSGDVTLVYSVTTPEIDTVYTYWALVRCPRCAGRLVRDDELKCSLCGRRYPLPPPPPA